MKASKFSGDQREFILDQGADGVPVADICWKMEISPATTKFGRIGHRQKAADLAAKSRWRIQPATVTKAGKP